MKNKVSLKIIPILLLLISTLPIGVYVSLSALNKLQNDADTINNIGYIRGSTQRLLQPGLKSDQQTVIHEIETKFQEVDRTFISENRNYLYISDFQSRYHQLKKCWSELKDLSLHSTSPTQIEPEQDSCWDIADTTVNAATQIAKKKHDETVLTFFSIAGIIFILLVFTLFLIYTEVRNRLEVTVLQDSLTKLYNRNHLLEQLKSRVKSFERLKYPFSILFIDIDHFKQINDTYGHHIGDTILKSFASILQTVLRDEDVAFRYGGEEFVILATYANASQAHILAERIRKKVSQYDFKIDYPVTISLGISEYRINDGIDKLLTQADNAMYKAKAQGRNQTCIYTP